MTGSTFQAVAGEGRVLWRGSSKVSRRTHPARQPLCALPSPLSSHLSATITPPPAVPLPSSSALILQQTGSIGSVIALGRLAELANSSVSNCHIDLDVDYVVSAAALADLGVGDDRAKHYDQKGTWLAVQWDNDAAPSPVCTEAAVQALTCISGTVEQNGRSSWEGLGSLERERGVLEGERGVLFDNDLGGFQRTHFCVMSGCAVPLKRGPLCVAERKVVQSWPPKDSRQ